MDEKRVSFCPKSTKGAKSWRSSTLPSSRPGGLLPIQGHLRARLSGHNRRNRPVGHPDRNPVYKSARPIHLRAGTGQPERAIGTVRSTAAFPIRKADSATALPIRRADRIRASPIHRAPIHRPARTAVTHSPARTAALPTAAPIRPSRSPRPPAGSLRTVLSPRLPRARRTSPGGFPRAIQRPRARRSRGRRHPGRCRSLRRDRSGRHSLRRPRAAPPRPTRRPRGARPGAGRPAER